MKNFIYYLLGLLIVMCLSLLIPLATEGYFGLAEMIKMLVAIISYSVLHVIFTIFNYTRN